MNEFNTIRLLIYNTIKLERVRSYIHFNIFMKYVIFLMISAGKWRCFTRVQAIIERLSINSI